MQMVMVCENAAELEKVSKIFDRRLEVNCSPIYGRVDYIEDGEVKDLIAKNPIVYGLVDDTYTYTVFNFHTGEKFEGVEGDVAGLANLPDGNFPF